MFDIKLEKKKTSASSISTFKNMKNIENNINFVISISFKKSTSKYRAV